MANPYKQKDFHLIIVAAGSGERFGADIPKQYVKIGEKSILRHTLDNALSWPGLLSVHVVINPAHKSLYEAAVQGLDLPPPITGGETRKDSVYKGIRRLSNVKKDDIILLHDAARPLAQATDINALLHALEEHRAATLAVPVSDTLRQSDNDAQATAIVERNGLWSIQTPQAFRYGDLKDAHENTPAGTVATDDTSLVSHAGIAVKLVHGSRSNIKITTQDDIKMADALLSPRTLAPARPAQETRTGMGFDVHAFEDNAVNKPLILCGIELDSARSLKGHSDADVALHALTDAILGAIGEGDIGQHFPPSDHTFKNMDSAVFLEKSMDMLVEKGGVLTNLDLTIICEAPKIGPHRETMQARVAEITGIDPHRINIKATTTEQLGFTGRGEGIAAQAVATVEMPTMPHINRG